MTPQNANPRSGAQLERASAF